MTSDTFGIGLWIVSRKSDDLRLNFNVTSPTLGKDAKVHASWPRVDP